MLSVVCFSPSNKQLEQVDNNYCGANNVGVWCVTNNLRSNAAVLQLK